MKAGLEAIVIGGNVSSLYICGLRMLAKEYIYCFRVKDMDTNNLSRENQSHLTVGDMPGTLSNWTMDDGS